MPTHVDARRLRRELGRQLWRAPTPHGSDGWALVRYDRDASVIVTAQPHDDGAVWVHASIAHRDRVPSYEELKLLHRAVFGDGYAYLVFPPKAQHVNIHLYALHLWGRYDGKPAIPEFAQRIGGVLTI